MHIETTHEKPYKYLGSQVTKMNNPKDYFMHFKDILEGKLKNINNSRLRGEFKLSIYEQYASPSMLFHFSIHTLHYTHLEELDKIAITF